MHHMSQNGTAQLIGGSLTDAPMDDLKARLSTLTAELDGVRQLTQGGGFNTSVGDVKSLTVVGHLKSLTYFNIWVRANLP